MHDAAQVWPWLARLKSQDLEELTSANILRTAAELAPETRDDMPSALMERLSSQEAQILAAVAAEPSPPVINHERSVDTLKRMRYERERAGIQREIDRLQAAGDTGVNLTVLLERKLALQRLLECTDGETGYNRRLG